MPPATRIGDLGLGHGSFLPTPTTGGSSNVMTCSLPQTKKGDSLMLHGSPSPSPPHGRSYSGGSSTVKVNGIGAVRIGDGIGCGGMAVMGCGMVIIGG